MTTTIASNGGDTNEMCKAELGKVFASGLLIWDLLKAVKAKPHKDEKIVMKLIIFKVFFQPFTTTPKVQETLPGPTGCTIAGGACCC